MVSIPFKLIKQDELHVLNDKIAALEAQINIATEFVKEIEKGNLTADYVLSDASGEKKNVLAESLLSLRTQLTNYALQEKERNWVTEGLAKFIDILRSKNEDISNLTDSIIRNLVKYMGANQGALYLVNDDDPKDTYIEMAACYAYERKKYLNQRLEIGEGLTGQAVLEKDIIYLTEIPQSYMRITSGLGNASPSNLLIVPLKIEEKVFGVVEVASFNKIEQYQIEFVQRLGESIASTLAGVKTGQRTQILLQQSQMQAEQMRSQEEEMRQNMEELSATQEEMQRVLKEAQDKEKYLNDLINVPKDSIFTVDKGYKIISFNKAMADGLQNMGIADLKGFDMLQLYPDSAERQKQKQYYDRAFSGENFEITTEYTHQGVTSYYNVNYAPLRNELGEAFAVACFGKDVTAMITAQKTAESALHDSKQQTEELRAQEEELRQNMEELSATQEEIQRILREVQDKESYLNGMINASTDSIVTVDKDIKVISFNNTLKAAYAGYFEIEKGFDLMQVFATPEDKAKYKGHYERVFKGETFEVMEHYNFGEIDTYFSVRYSPIKDQDGEIIAGACFATDISPLILAQKETERVLKEVKEQERYMTEIINVPNDSIFTLDKDFKLISFNNSIAKAMELSGIKLEKGSDLLSTLNEKEREREIKNYKKAFKGESFEVVNEINVFDQKMIFAINYAPLHDNEGNISAIAVFSKDVTALYKNK